MTPRFKKHKTQAALPVEWEERGDSPTLGALFLVGMLGQAADFDLYDLSKESLKASAFEPPSGEGSISNKSA